MELNEAKEILKNAGYIVEDNYTDKLNKEDDKSLKKLKKINSIYKILDNIKGYVSDKLCKAGFKITYADRFKISTDKNRYIAFIANDPKYGSISVEERINDPIYDDAIVFYVYNNYSKNRIRVTEISVEEWKLILKDQKNYKEDFIDWNINHIIKLCIEKLKKIKPSILKRLIKNINNKDL